MASWIVLGIVSSVLTPEIPTIEDIEKSVLANRRAIKKGHFVFDSTFRKGTRVFDLVTTVYLDGDRIRGDRQRPYEDHQGDAISTFYTMKSCFGGRFHVWYSDQVLTNGATIVATVNDVERVDRSGPYHVLDPRMVGMAPYESGLLRNFHMETFVAAPDRTEPSITREHKNGTDYLKLEYIRADGGDVRMWIAPTKGFSVVRMEHEFDAGGTHFLDAVDLRVKRHRNSEIWYPLSSHYQRIVDNTQVKEEERLKITVLSINEPIEPVVFTMADLGIPAGTTVHHVGQGGTDEGRPLVWDGNKITLVNPPQNLTDSSHISSGRSTRLFLTSVIFAILASILLWRYSRDRLA